MPPSLMIHPSSKNTSASLMVGLAMDDDDIDDKGEAENSDPQQQQQQQQQHPATAATAAASRLENNVSRNGHFDAAEQ
jgi:hypothetical protein